MGWGRTLLLGDIGNRLDIADTERDISELRSILRKNSALDRTQDQRLAQVELEHDELKLYLASLLRLLVKKGALAEEELSAFVKVIEDDDKPR